MKDHIIAAVVNDLRDTAIKFHDTQQLRERLRHCIEPLLAAAPQVVADERAAFDDWIISTKMIPKILDSEFQKPRVSLAWDAWQARAALAAAPVQTQEPVMNARNPCDMSFDEVTAGFAFAHLPKPHVDTAPVQPVAVPDGCHRVYPPTFPKYNPNGLEAEGTREMLWDYACLVGWRSAAPAAQGDAKDAERAEILEEAAKLCDGLHKAWRWDSEPDSDSGPRSCAAAIRAAIAAKAAS